MRPLGSRSRIFIIVSAAGLVLVLAASLAARVAARSAGPRSASLAPLSPSPATVPPPRPILPAELPTPFCWGCRGNTNAPLEFQVDLDLLAPLGDGASNAALWFARFAPRPPEGSGPALRGHRERRVETIVDGDEWLVLPGDDPLVLEAEAWVDQSTLSFYPEVWEVRGMQTSLPNLLLMMDLAKAWVARGKLSEDNDRAREDFRRVLRLGRLLRQDDVTIVQDLVAIACIRMGAESLYALARREADAATMVVAALVLADKDAMRMRTAQRITTLERGLRVEDPEADRLTLAPSDAELDAMIGLIREVPERRFRLEGLIGLHTVRHRGTPAQRDRALAILEEFSGSSDEITAGLARYLLRTELDATALPERGGHR